MTVFAENLRKLRLDRKLTQERAAEHLGVSAQAVSRWETGITYPDVLSLPQIAALYGVLVDELFRPLPQGYANNAQRLLAVYEQTGKHEDFFAAYLEFEKLHRAGTMTADDERSYGILHEYMTGHCLQTALESYDRTLVRTRNDDPELFRRTQRQKMQLRGRIGQGADCIDEQEAAVQANPDDPAEWVNLAAAYHMCGQHADALRVCREALTRFPDEGLLYVYAGDSCRALQQYAEAFDAWHNAVRLDDKFMDAMYSIAFCHEELGQYAKAAAQWDAIARRLKGNGMDVEAQYPTQQAMTCRQKLQA